MYLNKNNSVLSSIVEETNKYSTYEKMPDYVPMLQPKISYGFGWNHTEKRQLQQLITAKYLNRQLMRDSILSPTKIEGRGLFENPGLMKQFTNIGSISGNG